MERNLQNQLAFYLTGRREGSNFRPLDSSHRPALFARYRDLNSLRYDFPLVLNRDSTPETSILSLTCLVDEAVRDLADSEDIDRIARHGYRLERELRQELAAGGPRDFAQAWKSAAVRLAGEGDETILDSARRLLDAFKTRGDLVDADRDLATRALKHAWSSVQETKARIFRERMERLLLKLRDILEAEMVGSPAGRSPERLMAGVGSSFARTFDFEAMSRILVETKPGFRLSAERRMRISGLIDVLERQRFYPLGTDGPEPYAFSFSSCSDAISAYQERHAAAVEMVKALAIAEIETKGDYRELVHDVLFADFGANGLNSDELAELPDYLVCTDASTLDAAETAQIVDLLAAGLSINVLVRTDDVLEPSKIDGGHLGLGLRARQMVETAIGLSDVFVIQTTASNLYQMRDQLIRGLSYGGPALFSVFSGTGGHTGDIPAYLVAAAAMESRAFPNLIYDPSAGSDWASRLTVNDNPSPKEDWPLHTMVYEDASLQARSEDLAFTLADFMAIDDRYYENFAIVPQPEWSDEMVPIPDALQTDVEGLPDQVPCVTLVGDGDQMQRAIVDGRTLNETRRCLTMWHSLQELGGIHNSHAEQLLAREQNALADAAGPQPVADAQSDVATTVTEPMATAAAASSEPAADESHGDDPYIESARCTTCNECTNLNNRMFAYNAEKQAYISEPDAGTFRQLVEAAEGCQVSIIHPGKPRNPKEPGLEDLIKRAAEFN